MEHGGIGEGTVIKFCMRVMGRQQMFRAAITEPEPGRVLVETDLDTNGAITTFTLKPSPDRLQCDVTISTELPVRSGPLGAIQRALTTCFLRPIYFKELELLAMRATQGAAAG